MEAPSTIRIKIAARPDDVSDAQEVRRQVFQTEQGIDETLDFDGHDDGSDHLVAYADDKPIGTVRIRYPQPATAKIERLSVLKTYRGMGAGKQLMLFVMGHLSAKGIGQIILDSQENAKGFYEKLGFTQEGDVFEEVGFPHVKMSKKL